MRLFEAIICFILALVLHLGLWLWSPAHGVRSAGAGGDAALSLEAAPTSLAALVEAWQQPVPLVSIAPQMAVPAGVQTPPLTAPVSAISAFPVQPRVMPQLPASKPTSQQAPAVDTAPPPQPVPIANSAPSPIQRAAGAGLRQSAGRLGKARVSTRNAAKVESLMARWGARIRRSVERRKRYPRGTVAHGTVQIQLTVTISGQLVALRLRRSSGDASLDAAALDAVRRARFPRAPDGLSAAQHSFNLPVTFSR
jgi:protein TonB